MGVLPHPRNSALACSPPLMSGYLDPTKMMGAAITLDAGAVGWRFDTVTGAMETIDLASVAGNELELPLFFPDDEHFALGVGVDDTDRLFVNGNHHDTIGSPTTPHFLVCNDTSAFTNPASWAVASAAHFTGLGANSYTYCRFERLANGDLLHFLSQSESGTAQGRDWLGFRRSGGVWSPLVSDGHFATTENGPPTEADRVYIEVVQITDDPDNGEVVHVAGTWRLDDADANSTRDPWYLRSHDGGTTWVGVDGTAQAMPLTWANRAPATIVSGAYSLATRSLWVDPVTGHPDVLIMPVPSIGTDWERYTWNGSTWDTSAYTNLSGTEAEQLFRGERWIVHTNATRVLFRPPDGSPSPRLGGRIPSNYAPNPDPVWLRERGVFAISVPDGNTPRVATFGHGAQRYS